MRQLLSAACAALLMLGAAAPAHALFSDDEARKAILELRTKQTDADKRVADLTARLEASQRGQFELVNQIESLRADIARLRGQVETLTNELSVQQKRSRDLYGDLDARLRKFEPQSVTVDGQTGQVERAEQAAYDAALEQFRAGDFKAAIDGFRNLLARWPASVYAPSATYWLGSAYYASRDYKSAIATQQQLVDRFKTSPRVPEALLSMAASQIESKDKKGAAATLNRVIKEYPDTEAAKLARDRLPATK
ncbi:MAG: tol-pal system protein YbgF [Burkholderiaceae bacterium]